PWRWPRPSRQLLEPLASGAGNALSPFLPRKRVIGLLQVDTRDFRAAHDLLPALVVQAALELRRRQVVAAENEKRLAVEALEGASHAPGERGRRTAVNARARGTRGTRSTRGTRGTHGSGGTSGV